MNFDIRQCKLISDERGELVIYQDEIPFRVKRTYVMYGRKGINRGGHRHIKTIQAITVLCGSAAVSFYDKVNKFHVRSPNLNASDLLILPPENWHEIIFHEDSTLLVFASEKYDPMDYIYEKD